MQAKSDWKNKMKENFPIFNQTTPADGEELILSDTGFSINGDLNIVFSK